MSSAASLRVSSQPPLEVEVEGVVERGEVVAKVGELTDVVAVNEHVGNGALSGLFKECCLNLRAVG